MSGGIACAVGVSIRFHCCGSHCWRAKILFKLGWSLPCWQGTAMLKAAGSISAVCVALPRSCGFFFSSEFLFKLVSHLPNKKWALWNEKGDPATVSLTPGWLFLQICSDRRLMAFSVANLECFLGDFWVPSECSLERIWLLSSVLAPAVVLGLPPADCFVPNLFVYIDKLWVFSPPENGGLRLRRPRKHDPIHMTQKWRKN